MKVLVFSTLLLAKSASAAFVTYSLSQTNGEPSLVDGIQYGQVQIAEGVGGQLDFTVTPSVALTSLAGPSFGLQTFGFNVIGTHPLVDAAATNTQWTLPSQWSVNVAPPNNQQDGFGRFEVLLSGTGSTRLNPLSFSIKGTSLTLASFAELSTNSSPAQGAVFFSAHIAGFSGPDGINSAFFGGSMPVPANVPLPAAAGLLASGAALLTAIGRRRRQA